LNIQFFFKYISKNLFATKHNFIKNLIYQKATYILGCGELINELSAVFKKSHPLPDISDLYEPETFIDFYEKVLAKKIIVVNENEEDVTDSFLKESHLVKCYLIKSKICKYKYINPDYEKKIERNDVHIYKTIFYPPKSKPPNTN